MTSSWINSPEQAQGRGPEEAAGGKDSPLCPPLPQHSYCAPSEPGTTERSLATPIISLPSPSGRPGAPQQPLIY